MHLFYIKRNLAMSIYVGKGLGAGDMREKVRMEESLTCLCGGKGVSKLEKLVKVKKK